MSTERYKKRNTLTIWIHWNRFKKSLPDERIQEPIGMPVQPTRTFTATLKRLHTELGEDALAKLADIKFGAKPLFSYNPDTAFKLGKAEWKRYQALPNTNPVLYVNHNYSTKRKIDVLKWLAKQLGAREGITSQIEEHSRNRQNDVGTPLETTKEEHAANNKTEIHITLKITRDKLDREIHAPNRKKAGTQTIQIR